MKDFNRKKLTTTSKKTGLILGLLLISSGGAFAQSTLSETASSDFFLWLILCLEILLISIGLVLIFVVLRVNTILFQEETPEGEPVEEKSIFEILSEKLTGAVPIEKEDDVLTDHEYDGIRELDNNLPPWWVGMFYVTIVFSFLYVGYYHFFGGTLQEEAYENEMAEAKVEVEAYLAQMSDLVDETNVETLTDASAISSGKTIFQEKCIACHGAEGQGGIGPNLTDNYWIHGGGIKDVFKTVKYGVAEKGMIPWEAQLSPAQIQEVSSYILSIVGTNPPNAKEPQGDLYQPEGEESADAATGDTGNSSI
ncbi:cbb3-type cytochrome c oxidase N-terminal domain-containing protein [Flexithrix dorotheae]|uniref:cbb3-type cytochrome c oxidase N-terminal domain-containing protein n=1 Tax=Flexithrix dorotheae TaxID=70993 RepID=UPI0003827060|nr:cbb3-type cytochrome c oxidase N-terminal domain-containing protein [Flexithrix dorotheae]